jgi:hypothetical protein
LWGDGKTDIPERAKKEDAPAGQSHKISSSAAPERPTDASTKGSKGRVQLLKVLRVLFRKFRKILRHVCLGEDRICWANRNAGAAINAVHRVDVELRDLLKFGFIFPRMNTVYRTNFDAFLILGATFNDYE